MDIPGTNVNFFLYRYTGDEVPYDAIAQIWKNLSDVFIEWASQGADPTALTSDDVTVATVGDVVGIYLKGRLIVEVDEFHAGQLRNPTAACRHVGGEPQERRRHLR